MSLLIIQFQTCQLSEMQRLLIDIYYNDGHSYEFLQHLFHTLFQGDESLVDEYLDELFRPKLLAYVENIEE